jgi:predicted acyltransferase
VLVAAGLATLALALIYFIVDVRVLRRWSRPFLWLGVNPLAIYFCSEILRYLLDGAWIQQGVARTTPRAWLFWEILEPAFRPWPAEWASLVSGAGLVAFWLAVGSVLYRYRIRIQV